VLRTRKNKPIIVNYNTKQKQNMKDLLKALAQFNLEVTPITKNSVNPFFKSNYASLDHIQEHIKPFLQSAGLLVVQPSVYLEGKEFVQTFVFHVESGESIDSLFPVVVGKATAQDYGSATSFAKRYSLTGVLNLTIQGLDDDGNAASTTTAAPKQTVVSKVWLVESNASWGKIVEALNAKTATIADVRKKFNVSKAIEAKLLSLVA
jgi:hypothetical protein